MEREFYIPKCTEPVLIVNENALRLISYGAKSPLPCVNTLNHASVSKGHIIHSILDKNKKWHIEDLQRYVVEFNDEAEYLFQLVSCGSCPTCQEKRQNDLVNRCRLESELYDCPPYFFTLTYAPKYLPYCGELKYTDVQRFWKRLRINWTRKGLEHDIRYLVAGEYGSKYGRPHYHVILWNNPYHCNELMPYEHNKLAQDIFDAWSMCEPQSFDFGQCGDGAAAYAAKYAGKPKSLCKHWNKPFIRTSIGHGGIGYPFLAKDMEYYRKNVNCDKIVYTSKSDFQIHEINYGAYISTHIFPSNCRLVNPQIKSLYKQLTDLFTIMCQLRVVSYNDAHEVLELLKPPYTRNKLSQKECSVKLHYRGFCKDYFLMRFVKVCHVLYDELSVQSEVETIQRPVPHNKSHSWNDLYVRMKHSFSRSKEIF